MNDGGFKLLIGAGATLMIMLFLWGAIVPELGDGERLGVVVYTRKASYPCKMTLVWIRIYYTDGIMNEDAFVRVFHGWHEFELGQLYRINYHREWTQIYKRITSVEIVEIE